MDPDILAAVLEFEPEKDYLSDPCLNMFFSWISLANVILLVHSLVDFLKI